MRTTSSSSGGWRLLPTLVLLMALAASLLPAPSRSYAATGDLFFSEYIEGSSYNKALEIYNGTGATVDLSAYAVELYSNGAAAPNYSVALSSVLADGDVYVLAHGSADAAILAVTDLISNVVVNFNGDDAVALRKNGTIVDVIGQIGFDPGTRWGTEPLTTVEHSLRRLNSVCAGDSDGSDAFDPAAEWEGFAQNTFDGLGSHSDSCGGTPPPASIDLSTYARIGRYDLPTPARGSAPAGSELALEVSAVTYNPETDTLFVLGDEGTSIVQVSKSGQLIDSMTLAAGDFADTEGLSYVGASNQFVLVEERLRHVNRFTYVGGGTLARADVQSVALGTTIGNIGLEGISFDPQTGGYILVKEMTPQGIFQTDIDFAAGTASNGSPSTENSTNLFDPALMGLSDIADVYALANLAGSPSDGNLLVLSQEGGRIVNVDRAGAIASSLTISGDSDNPLSVATQGFEGVTMGGDGLLYIVGEQAGGDGDHPQLWVYAPTSYAYPNAAPVAVSLSNATTSLPENTSTAAPVQLGTVVVSDDAQGSNTLSLGGADAADFEIVGSGLFLKAGTALDFETKPSYVVTVNVDDASVGTTPDVSTDFTLEISDTALADFDLQVSEIWPGNSLGDDLTKDWFEITNVGSEAWVVGVAPALYYDDDSQSPAEADLISGITQINPGKSVVVVVGKATDAQSFAAVWDSAINLSGVEIGSTDGAGLGAKGDGVSLFVGLPAAGSAPADYASYPAGSVGQSYNVDLAAFSVAGQNGAIATAANPSGQPAVGSPGNGEPFTKIHAIQGSGAASPLENQTVTIEGVVVGDFEGSTGLSGFFVQEQADDHDSDPLTSEGVFVYNSSRNSVSVGDLVRVIGKVSEYNGLTEISPLAGATTVLSSGNSIAPTAVAMPFASADELERFEGMLVSFAQALTISEYYNFDRYGELVLGLPLDGYERFFTPTNIVAPGQPAIDLAAQYALRRITLDDGSNTQNPASLRHPNGLPFALDNIFRGGDKVTNLTGVLHYGFNLYRIQPTAPADYAAANPRPASPPAVGGTLKVVGQNTLNFFTSIDTGAYICGPAQNMECRGADNASELERQKAKLLAALKALDADIVGLNELENTAGVEPLQTIVDGLNAELGAGTYAYINTGTIGGDAIKVGIIYKPARVSPVGAYAILDSTVDPRFVDSKSRPALAQTFADNDGGRFTVAVNHLKSKGSACDDLSDPDTGDGQGNCNLTRTNAAKALVDWLDSDPTGYGDGDYLIIGDLNSYALEDPISAIKAGPDGIAGSADDYVNLIAAYQGAQAYSYVFDGQNGYLDHALASASLAAQVTGSADWHINADEADVLDYDTSFKPAAVDAIYAPDQYRISDHDSVLIGLSLTPSSALKVTKIVRLGGADLGVIDERFTVCISGPSFPAGDCQEIAPTSLVPNTATPETDDYIASVIWTNLASGRYNFGEIDPSGIWTQSYAPRNQRVSVSDRALSTATITNTYTCAYIQSISLKKRSYGVEATVLATYSNGEKLDWSYIHAEWTMPDGSIFAQTMPTNAQGKAVFLAWPANAARGDYRLKVVGISDPLNADAAFCAERGVSEAALSLR